MTDVENGDVEANGDDVVKNEPKIEAAAEVAVSQPADQPTDEQVKYISS